MEKIKGFADEAGRDLSDFQWAYMPYISIYPTIEEATRVSAEALGGNYIYQGEFENVVQRYCILGPVESCIARLKEYVDAGVRHIVFSVACPQEDKKQHIEAIVKEIIPGLQAEYSA